MPPEMLQFDLGGEPALVRPYVRYLANHCPVPTVAAPAEAPAPVSPARPDYNGRHARTLAAGRPARARARAQARRRSARRQFLGLGSGMLLLVLGSTVLAVGAEDRPPAVTPVLVALAVNAPQTGRLTRAAVPAPVDEAGSVQASGAAGLQARR